MEETIEKLKQDARDSWSGPIGEKRAEELEAYLRGKLKEYSGVLGVPAEDILKSWEADRDYSAINYYQEANQFPLDHKRARVFDTVDDFFKSIGEKKFRCPSCRAISTDPYNCNSGKEVGGKVCDWSVGGLFRDMGYGVYVYIKDKLKGDTIFKPVSWEEEGELDSWNK